MMPEGAYNKIRSVQIFYSSWIRGFKFFDKDGALIWKVGYCYGWPLNDVKTVMLAENEVIIGVVAKLRSGFFYGVYESSYTDFQF